MDAISKRAIFVSCLVLATATVVAGHDRILFFGDSYLDTGNRLPPPPKPYGLTWPGKPAGRYSDGYVFTDVFTQYLQIDLPIEYTKLSGKREVKDGGVNYAVAGAKAISQSKKASNISTQISQFEEMVMDKSFDPMGQKVFIAVINIGGNDYIDLGTVLDSDRYTPLVTKVLAVLTEGVTRLLKAGVKTFYLLNLPPSGCLPVAAVTVAYVDCVDRLSRVTQVHNKGLRDLRNNLASQGADVTILDIEKSVNSIVSNPKCFGFNYVFAPCCVGFTLSIDEVQFGCTGDHYTVCDRPERRLFFDSLHPTDAGWRDIMTLLAIGTNFTSPSVNLCTKLNKTCEGFTNGTVPTTPRPIDGGSCNVTDILSAGAGVINLPMRAAYAALFALGLGVQLYFWL